MKKAVIGLTFFTAIGIFVYWTLVFSGAFPVIDLIPGYAQWFMSFPVADLWIAVSSLTAGLLMSRDKELSVPFGIASGSSLTFLGLNALLFGFNTGLLFKLTAEELIEIAIKVYCLTVGPLFMIWFWKSRKDLGHQASKSITLM
jgi:hypothetical protein